MKKILLFALVLVLSLSLAGCNRDSDDDTNGDDDNGETCTNNAANGVEYFFDQNQQSTATITVWLDDDDYAASLIAAFEAANPGIRVRYENVGAVDVRQRLELYSGSSAAADVVVFPHDHIGAALNSNLLHVIEGDYANSLRERMILSAIDTATAFYDFDTNQVISGDEPGAQSYLFGAPLSGESLALFYNKTLLQELTGSSTPAATFEQILTERETYLDDLEDDLMIAMDVGNPYDMHFLATAFGFKLFGEDHLDKDQANLDSPEMVAALTYMKETLVPSLNDLNSADLNGDIIKGMFEAGTLPYIIDGPWSISRYISAGDTNDFDFGVTRIPTINGSQPLTFSGVQMAAVYSGTTNATAAFRFLEFMTSNAGLEILYETTNKLPALEDVSVVAGVSDDAYLSGISDQLSYSHPMPIIPEMGYFWDNAGTMYSSVWNGTRTPQAAATEAQNGFDASRN